MFSSKKTETSRKFAEKYGSPGTEDEYRAIGNMVDPSVSSLTTMSEKAQKDFEAQRSYTQQLRDGKELATTVRKFIVETWWKPLCQSANTAQFHDILFDAYLFDEEGVLDIKEPGLRKIVMVLHIAYMRIVDHFGQDTLSGWVAEWCIDKEGQPFIAFVSNTLEMCFGMTQPKGGYFDSNNELKELRKKRDAGEYFEIPEDKLKHYEPDLVVDEIEDGSSSPPQNPTSSTAGSPLIPVFETSNLDDEAWSIIDKRENDLEGGQDGEDEQEYINARLSEPTHKGYTYKKADATPARKGWLW